MIAPSEVGAGSPNRVASVASIVGATYAWSITNGTITAGQGTNQITFTAGTPGTLVLNVSLTKDFCPFGGAFANVDGADGRDGGPVLRGHRPAGSSTRATHAGPLGGPALLPAPSPDRTFAITGVCGVPSDARSVSLNVTVTNVQTSGTLLLYRGDGAPSLASTINFRPGVTRANNDLTQLALDGTGTFQRPERLGRDRWTSSWT